MKTALVSAALAGLMASISASAAPPTSVELNVTRIFVPEVGYDDNDRVEIVLDGKLPDACYRLGKTVVSKSSEGVFSVHQYGLRLNADPCGPRETLPPYMKLAVPYSLTVSLGHLAPGDYELNYHGERASEVAAFAVEESPLHSIDARPYAPVDGVHVAAIYFGEQQVEAVLSGTLPSLCAKLREPVEYYRTGDTFVLLPQIDEVPGQPCAAQVQPFEKRVSLGEVPQGRYLVHVRSANGISRNRVFSVEPYREPIDPIDED